MSPPPELEGLTHVLDQLVENTDGREVSFEDIVGAFGRRAFGPLLLVPAVIAVAPTGAIPGMSLLTGAIIALVSVQLMLGRDRPWLPARLLGFSFRRERLVRVVNRARPYTSRVDRFIRPRLRFATQAPFVQLLALIMGGLGLSMFPLAALPFAVALPGTAVILLSLGLTTRDGMLVVLGLAFVAGLAAISGLLVERLGELGLANVF